jgi:hypothetical protein
MLQIVFLVTLERVSSTRFSTRRGAWAWFHEVWTCGAKVLEYRMIASVGRFSKADPVLIPDFTMRTDWHF